MRRLNYLQVQIHVRERLLGLVRIVSDKHDGTQTGQMDYELFQGDKSILKAPRLYGTSLDAQL